jgi:hypothetical protein
MAMDSATATITNDGTASAQYLNGNKASAISCNSDFAQFHPDCDHSVSVPVVRTQEFG